MSLHYCSLTVRFGNRKRENEQHIVVTALIGTLLLIIDIALLVTAGIFLFRLLSYLIVPREIGFYCNDQSIKREFRDHTISVAHVIFGSVVFPALIVPFTEAYILRVRAPSGDRLRKWFRNGTRTVITFYIGFFVKAVFMEIGKCGFGRLRPNFLSMCQPDWNTIDCSDQTAYIAHVQCTSNEHYTRVSRGSFPSGHAAAAVYGFTFLYFYFNLLHNLLENEKQSWERFGRFKTRFLIIYGCWALVACVTRVTDGWHFTSDVAGGIVLGLVIGCLFFARKDTKKEFVQRF